jgi:hypothetical protein
MQNRILNSLGLFLCVLKSSKAAILTAEHTVPVLVFCLCFLPRLPFPQNFNKDVKIVQQYYPNILPADPFWLLKITTDPHILAHVNTECPKDRCSKLKIYIKV